MMIVLVLGVELHVADAACVGVEAGEVDVLDVLLEITPIGCHFSAHSAGETAVRCVQNVAPEICYT